MSDTTIDLEQEQPQKRPVFLTVLCILTWVGSGIGFLSGLVGLFTLSAAQKTYGELERAAIQETMFGDMPSLEDYIFWTNVSNATTLLTGALCILGAILMFQLKKVGFFLYVGGCVIAIVVSLMSINVLMPSGLAGFGMIAVVLGAMVSVAFIIMYGVNLKHMK